MTVPAADSVQQSPTRSVELERSGPFSNLRGIRWRINLGILPSSYSSIDDLRRVTADSRRRYAGLRRHLLVDPHWQKDGSNSPDLVMDNPLSQNPDSTWGRFFRSAELGKMVDQDLSRLYPEHGNYFQTPGCQGMLRRILLLWCLRHPEFGYIQGMHELLAPLLYVLHVDIERLSQVRKEYEDHFTDKFDGLSFHENDLACNFDLQKFLDSMEDEIGSHGNSMKVRSLDELDPEIQTIVWLSDAYGAEGELGIVLSEKFMEHDAYCMFDALMGGVHGSVSLANFFAHSHSDGSLTGLPPIIEASSAIYRLLSVVDSSLHSHLVELGVEPQYFGLRWLRVLFGREFSLGDLLIIWDEIFASDNSKLNKDTENDAGSEFGILSSRRGVLIASMAVSMMLYIRSSLLATENATTCLQRLLNFPEIVNLNKIIGKAKSLRTLALDASMSSSSPPFNGVYNRMNSAVLRGPSLSSESISPRTPLNVVPDSYWEEKWRDLHKAEEQRQDCSRKQNPTRKKGWSEKVKLRLSRTESEPTPRKFDSGKKHPRSCCRRSSLEALSKELGFEEEIEKADCFEVSTQNDHPSVEAEVHGQDSVNRDFACTSSEERYLTVNAGSEENSSLFSDPGSPVSRANENENENGLEESSIASNLSVNESDSQSQNVPESPSLPVSRSPEDTLQDFQSNNESLKKTPTVRNVLSGKFQWFWKFGRNTAGEETSNKVGGATDTTKSANNEGNQSNSKDASNDYGSCKSSSSSKGETVDQNAMGTFKNLGQSMIEHIQVIESAFQQERGQVGSRENFSKNVLVGKGQATAVTALKELRKISNLLSEM